MSFIFWCITQPLHRDAQKSCFASAMQIPAKIQMSKLFEEKESLSESLLFYRASNWPNKDFLNSQSAQSRQKPVLLVFPFWIFFWTAFLLSGSACSYNSFHSFWAKDCWVLFFFFFVCFLFSLKDINTFHINIILPLMYLLLRLTGTDANTI